MRRKRMHWLAGIINERGFTTGAEVGAATGNTTLHLMENCPNLQELIIADDWRPIPEAATALWQGKGMKMVFVQKLNGYLDRLLVYEGTSWERAAEIMDESLDFVFIDASHDYESVKKDLAAWWPKVKKMGMFCGHDLHFEGVRRALAEFDHRHMAAGIDNCWYINKLI